MQIRKMQESDVEQAACLEAAVFSDPWSERSFLEALQNEATYYIVVEEQGEILGQCGYYNMCGEGEILNVSVKETARRQGIARRMLLELMEYGYVHGIGSYTLEVRAGNCVAIALYESLGFQKMGVRPGFYENPKEDAIIMNAYRDYEA